MSMVLVGKMLDKNNKYCHSEEFYGRGNPNQ